MAEKDPEFYKYLQENDRELLDFDPGHAGGSMQSGGDDDEEDGGFEMDGDARHGDEMQEDGERMPVLTKDVLKGWQKAILEVSHYEYFPVDLVVLIMCCVR